MAGVFIFSSSCRKDQILNDSSAKLAFSSDTVIFDTVFTTVGSITKQLKIYNHYNKTLKISSITLGGGSTSNFTINVNGKPGASASNIEIGPKDSLYIFVRVTVDPNNKNTPLLITDSLTFITNSNTQKIQLAAYGQDAHFIVANQSLSGLNYKIVAGAKQNITWTNDKPYVVYGFAVIDSTGTLNIGPGVKIYFHSNSGMWVYKGGHINVNGQKDSVVTFQGDRLESWYQDSPGQWDRIWLNEGTDNNVFNYAVIKNGFIGIQAEILNTSMGVDKLVLKNTIIQNMSAFGIFTKGYNITASNSIISNCGSATAYLSVGGDYDFRQCTMANYWKYGARTNPTLVIANYYKDNANNIIYQGDMKNAYFGNCIIWGNNDEEILPDNLAGTAFNYQFYHCLLKTKLDTTHPNFLNCIRNSDPLFKNTDKYDFHLTTGSPAINKGDITLDTYIRTDLDGIARLPGVSPDLGVYQFVK